MRIELSIVLGCALLGACASNNANSGAPRSANRIPTNIKPSEEPSINADTRFAAGQLAESQGDPAHAIEQYREAARLNPKHEQALYRLGILYTYIRQYDAAIDSWKRYIRVTKESATAYSNLGFCYELAGQLRDAEASYLQGVKLEPSNQPCRVNYGLLLARTGRKKESIEQLSVVLSAPQVHYNLASVYEQTGKKDQARLEYETALELDPKYWEAQSRLSKLD